MSVSVIIPKENPRVYGQQDGLRCITDEVKLWLETNCPRGQVRQSHYLDKGPGFFYGENEYVGEEWTFRDPSIAALFKLTFGGR